MRSTKSNGQLSLEDEIGGNVRALARTSAGFSRPENCNEEMSANNLGTLLRRVSEASAREIESLIDELHGLRRRLETHGDRIQSDIAGYAEFSQGVMQLAAIISDNMKKLQPGVQDVSP